MSLFSLLTAGIYILAAPCVFACDIAPCLPAKGDKCGSGDKGLHVLVEAVGSCAVGASDRHFLDVKVLESFHSDVEVPVLKENERLRLDYGVFLNCNDDANANAKECLHSCAPREFAYPFEAEVEYVLYADVISKGNTSANSGASQLEFHTICNKQSSLKVASGEICSPNIREPTGLDLRLLRCSCKGGKCGASRILTVELIVLGCVILTAVVVFSFLMIFLRRLTVNGSGFGKPVELGNQKL